jgi:lysophospholipase L1-like esterase
MGRGLAMSRFNQAINLAMSAANQVLTLFPIKGKTQFRIPYKTGSINLFDVNTVTINAIVNHTNGTVIKQANYCVSDYIEVEQNAVYSSNRSISLAYYNANKEFVSGVASATQIKIPVGVKYLRFNISIANSTTEGLFKSTNAPPIYSFYNIPNYEILASSIVTGIQLPPTIYAVDGKEVNIYFDNLLAGDAENFDWDIESSKGTQQNERWTFTPTSQDVGSHAFIVKSYKNKEIQVSEASANIVVTDSSNGTGVTKTCLFIGDSITAAGKYTDAVGGLLNLFSGAEPMGITLIGTQGVTPNLHEGYGGWTINKFFTDASSPFVKSGAFNFSQYMTDNSFTSVDVVGIMLGTNDVSVPFTDDDVLAAALTAFAQLEGMITNIKSFNENVKIGIMITTPPSKDQDAFGENYGAGTTRWKHKRKNLIWVKNLIMQFAGRENEGIYLVPVNLNLDTVHNMSKASAAPWNSRTSETIERQNNGVHPADTGQYQIADVIYYWLKSLAT